MAPTLIARRAFLKGGGLALAFYALKGHGASKKTNEPAAKQQPVDTANPKVEASAPGLNPNVFVHLTRDGMVAIVCHRSEMGQGIRSSLPVLIADELGADMARVKVVQAVGDKKYGDQNTDGSSSIRGVYENMRKLGATPRMMLVAAAAKRWGVKPESCTTANHAVVHTPTGRTLGFGELADEAAKQPVPKDAEVVLRPDAELKQLTHRMPLLDGPAYVTGAAKFGADVVLPGMLTAVIARPPVVGGRVARFDPAKALAIQGVKRVIELPAPKPPYMFQPWGGVAVVAENTWAALEGRRALEITWEHGDNAVYDSAEYKRALSASVSAPGKVLRKVGDVDAALGGAARVIEAEYHVPHLPHLSMEPPAAVARIEDGKCEVWSSTQNPQAARTEAARALGIGEDKVTVHVTFLGGGFGRKSKADFVSEAVLLAREAGAPVRVQWTREDDVRHDYYNAVNAQRLTAGLDAQGKVIAWRHRTAFPPIGSTFAPKVNRPGIGDLQQGVLDLGLAVPNVSAEACEANVHTRIGWLRSVYNIFHGFGIGSFIDELAHARGTDPLATWLEVLGPPRKMGLKELGVEVLRNYGASLEKHPVDVGRLRGVIERVAAISGWADRKASGRALGIAGHRSFLAYTAAVASVKRGADGRISVDEVWLVADAGRIVNPDRVRSQMEGAVVFGLSLALYGGITMKGGAVQQSNFHDHPLARI
ncbi:MAG TPA: molybdopterin cofactor-binding domain-containing protein, partial [Myxococcaceae bacterium]|nr:molybdopterin cofactor-binding domain-containing protein [Myxococcaceae bacterium]